MAWKTTSQQCHYLKNNAKKSSLLAIDKKSKACVTLGTFCL